MASIGFPYILDISDDVLLLIFSYLKGYDLLNLAETCERFHKIAGDKTLWIDADFSGGCTSLQQFKRYLKFLTHSTKRLVLRGYKKKYAATPKWKTPMISAALLKLIGNRCPNLESLEIREGYVDANKLKIIDFENVPSLLSLRIEDCEFVNLPTPPRDGSYFKNSYKVLPRLEELNIIKCGWVDDYDVMVLSKANTLKRLTLRSLPRVGRAMAYLSLAFRFGFQNLEELDLRGTSLRDSEVNSIVQNNSGLRALYIGPVDGRVVRLSEDAWSSGHNMVMPDPRRRHEERQQVVVINVGPDGPQWRQVRDEDLDGLGLQWVRNNPLARPQPPHDPDRHYFIGQDGRPIGENEEQRQELEEENGNHRLDEPPQRDLVQQNNREQEHIKEVEEENGNHERVQAPQGGPSHQRQMNQEQEPKRNELQQQVEQETDDDEDYEEVDKIQPPSKRRRLNSESAGENLKEQDDFSDEDERRNLGNHLNQEDNWVSDDDNDDGSDIDGPDEHLSDHIAGALREHTKHLEKLVLSGCAITDAGLHEILRVVPSLRFLDVRNTRVTSNGLEQARVINEDCVILDGNTRTTSDKNR